MALCDNLTTGELADSKGQLAKLSTMKVRRLVAALTAGTICSELALGI